MKEKKIFITREEAMLEEQTMIQRENFFWLCNSPLIRALNGYELVDLPNGKCKLQKIKT